MRTRRGILCPPSPPRLRVKQEFPIRPIPRAEGHGTQCDGENKQRMDIQLTCALRRKIIIGQQRRKGWLMMESEAKVAK